MHFITKLIEKLIFCCHRAVKEKGAFMFGLLEMVEVMEIIVTAMDISQVRTLFP